MTFQISEFSGLAVKGPAQVAGRILASGSVDTGELYEIQAPETAFIRVHTENDAFIAIGDEPDASDDETPRMFLAAGSVEYLEALTGQSVSLYDVVL